MSFRVLITAALGAAAFSAMALGAMAQQVEPAPAVETTTATTATSPATETPVVDAAAEKARDEQRVCKRTETTGSRLGGRQICMTRAEWRTQAERAREAIRSIQNGPTMQCGQSAMNC